MHTKRLARNTAFEPLALDDSQDALIAPATRGRVLHGHKRTESNLDPRGA